MSFVRDRNYLCHGKASIQDDDLISAKFLLGPEVDTLLEEIQYLRGQNRALKSDVHTLQSDIASIIRGRPEDK